MLAPTGRDPQLSRQHHHIGRPLAAPPAIALDPPRELLTRANRLTSLPPSLSKPDGLGAHIAILPFHAGQHGASGADEQPPCVVWL